MSEIDRYRQLRMQLAELGRKFFDASKQFPATFYEFVAAGSPVPYEIWRRWIKANRTAADLENERWEIYQAGWDFDCSSLEVVESDRTRDCGVLFSPSVEAAQATLQDLAGTGIQILRAIREVVKELTSVDTNVDALWVLPDGHRGWLDLVRRTALVNRGISLKVDRRLFNAAKDRQSQLVELHRTFADHHNGAESPKDSNVMRVTPDIFSASANAIRIWLAGIQDEPIATEWPGLNLLQLPSPDNCDHALDVSDWTKSLSDSNSTVSSIRRPKRKRGRPRLDEKTLAEDRRIFETKRSGTPNEELARRFNLSIDEIALRIDRERKRHERAS